VGKSVPTEAQLSNPEHDTLAYLRGVPDFGEVSPMPKFYVSGVKPHVQIADLLVSFSRSIHCVNSADRPYVVGGCVAYLRPDLSQVDADYLRIGLRQQLNKLSSLGHEVFKSTPSVNVLGALELEIPSIAHQQIDVAYLLVAEREIEALSNAAQRKQMALAEAFTNMFQQNEVKSTWLGLVQLGLVVREQGLFMYSGQVAQQVATLKVGSKFGEQYARLVEAHFVKNRARLVQVHHNDILICRRSGAFVPVLGVCESGQVVALNDDVELLRPNRESFELEFAFEYFKSAQFLLDLNLLKAKNRSRWIPKEQLETAVFRIPNISEQRKLLEVTRPLRHELDIIKTQIAELRHKYWEHCERVFNRS
jgi:hypothetical protein